MTDLDGITVVTEPSEAYLNSRQLEDYRSQRRSCLGWLLKRGKDPEVHDGYAHSTVSNRGSRMDYFYRWVWQQEDRYVANPTLEHADAFVDMLAERETSNADKSNYVKAVRMLSKWRHHEQGIEMWEPAHTFSGGQSSTQPRGYLTREERPLIREAALEYGSIPNYTSLSPSERDRWKAHLAQRFEKPKSEVTPQDWERANGWKFPSLVSVSLDAGLRPIEVERARTYWVDIPNQLLRIPKQESSKNEDHWRVSISERTASMLERWLEERIQYEHYEDTDALWLTRSGNAYGSKGIERSMDWRAVYCPCCSNPVLKFESLARTVYTPSGRKGAEYSSVRILWSVFSASGAFLHASSRWSYRFSSLTTHIHRLPSTAGSGYVSSSVSMSGGLLPIHDRDGLLTVYNYKQCRRYVKLGLRISSSCE